MANQMKVTVFGKSKNNKDNKAFTAYSGRLTRKDGSELSVGIKFRQPCVGPKKEDCPVNIIFDKADANLSQRYDSERDTMYYTLWVSKYQLGEPYEDHSLDDF